VQRTIVRQDCGRCHVSLRCDRPVTHAAARRGDCSSPAVRAAFCLKWPPTRISAWPSPNQCRTQIATGTVAYFPSLSTLLISTKRRSLVRHWRATTRCLGHTRRGGRAAPALSAEPPATFGHSRLRSAQLITSVSSRIQRAQSPSPARVAGRGRAALRRSRRALFLRHLWGARQ
jgi:hypothetical protein